MAKTQSKISKEFPAFAEFINKKVRVETIDGKAKIGVLKQVETFEIVIETNIYTKDEPIMGYMLFLKHAIRSLRQMPEEPKVKSKKGE